MKIETKFSTGDKAYFIYKNRIAFERVYKLYIEKEREHDLSVKYGFRIDSDYAIIHEENCFTTREELIKSL